MNLIKVEERTNKHSNGEFYSFSYHSPTHWASSGICEITKNTNGEYKLNWGCGGTNGEFSNIVIADAMTQAFAMAKNRLIELEAGE